MHHLLDDVTSQTISKNYSKLPPTLEKQQAYLGGAAALMLFQEPHPSSKLGDVSLKTPCIIFLMMLPPKQSQKIIQSYRRPWRSSRIPWSCCPPWSCCLHREC